MELQTDGSPETSTPSRNVPADESPPPPPSERQLSASLPILRFPKPQGSQRLANWISSSSPDIMQPSNMSDTSSLADSAYEIIHGTDTESQDGRLTESTGSLSASRPDDVHSLDGSENHYASDSDDESDHSSHASSIRYADQALQNPSTQRPSSSLEYGSTTEGSGVVVRSIEFHEHGTSAVLVDEVLVTHAIREFSEEESSAITQQLGLPDAPKRLVAAIRQTMSQSYLSTREPLRVLYVGRADAQRSILLKICSAIWASPKNGAKDQDHLNRHREGLYNIVPISSFGPAPELDLMEASHYQIKVEHCTSAEEVACERDSFLGDPVYSINIEEETSYRSLFSPTGSVVQPKWDLPHVAVFYCSELDDAEAERTRHVAWSFMNRHGVPAIFIADRQNFTGGPAARWGEYINEHTVHLCLESRDAEKPMPPQRFPIDYLSFMDIDARQMNRNLAYLTGLSEFEESVADLELTSAKELEPRELEPLAQVKAAFTKFVARQNPKWWMLVVAPVLMSLLAPLFIAVFATWLCPDGRTHLQPPASTGVCVSSQTYPGVLTATKSSSVATSTTTVVINVTSTKTVQVSQAKPSTSTLASALSFAGFLSDRPLAVPAEPEVKRPVNSPKKTVCSVRVYGPTEFLVAIPSRNKAVWLAQGAIDIDVHRGEDALKTKISSVDEGVLVELGPKDAYGVLNVSVVTSRRPRINETFQVDFGKTAAAELFEGAMQMLRGTVKKLSSNIDGTSQVLDDAFHEGVSAIKRAAEAARTRTGDAVNRINNNIREHVREHLARERQAAATFRKEVDLSILQAQIASRLWWLKMQGRTEEYAEYQRKATRFLKMKHDELVGRRDGQKKASLKELRRLLDMRRGSYWSSRKDDGGREKGMASSSCQDGGRESRWWKKMIMGGE